MAKKKADDGIPLNDGVAYYMGDDTFVIIRPDEGQERLSYPITVDDMKRMLVKIGAFW